jgi:hypothetical protein
MFPDTLLTRKRHPSDKDTFISNVTSTQKAGDADWVPASLKGSFPSFAGYHETGAATHALMALLSMAHVTFSDAVGETNATLIKQLIRADGMLLKADRPVTAIDAQFQAMLFGAWPSQEVPASKAGSLFTMPCDPHNKYQQFEVSKGRLTVADGQLCLTAGGGMAGSSIIAAKCSAGRRNSSQAFQLTSNTGGPRGSLQYAVTHNSSRGRPLCLQLHDGGAELVACDAGVADQGFAKARLPRAYPDPDDSVFNIATLWHDDMNCLTVARAPQNGAFTFDSEAERATLADELFPHSDWSVSAQYRDAYTMSAGLMQSVKQRQAQASAQCGGRLGAPQGPLGEIYSTHATIGGMTWRYVVGVQLSSNYSVTTHDLAMGSGSDAGSVVSYRYDHAAPGFKPSNASELRKLEGTTVLELQENANEFCDTGPAHGIKTRCFPFELHAVAPVASNGWALTGETGKMVPISNARISSVAALPSGGFTVGLKGAPAERVTMGAVDVKAGKAPVYTTATIGTDGTATLTLK